MSANLIPQGEVAQPHPSPRPSTKRTTALVWIGLILAGFIIVPAVGCAALGFAIAASGAQPATAGFGPAVGIIRVEGPILPGRGTGGLGGPVALSETIVEQIEQAHDDPNIRAVVLRIDSPGGGVVASDEIHHALLSMDKPLVVSMGTLAASGGYYVAATADYIYATPHTLTGSIGVISEFITAEELLDELGVEIVIIAAGDLKDFGTPTRHMTEEERAYWQALIDRTHEAFIQVVAQGRGMDVERVRAIADGRVFTGEEAVELGLVDEIGYFEDAIAKAAELGGISGEPRVVELAPEPGLLEALYGYQAQQHPMAPLEVLHQLTLPTLQFRYIGPQE